MGKYKYCGLDAGFLFRSHRECRKRHELGLEECLDALNAYFKSDKTIGEVVKEVAAL